MVIQIIHMLVDLMNLYQDIKVNLFGNIQEGEMEGISFPHKDYCVKISGKDTHSRVVILSILCSQLLIIIFHQTEDSHIIYLFMVAWA